jgi:threonine synthase
VVCPHTAVGVKVAADKRISGRVPMVTLATAHAAKFPDAVEAACGVRPDLPPHMADLFERSERVTRVSNDLEALKDIILQKVRK